MKVINLFGGPGVGKSTTASGLFYTMKKEGYSVELVTEYAKDRVWSEDYKTLDNQLYMLAKQENRLRKLIGKVEYVVCDSPLLNAEVYLKYKAFDYNVVCSASRMLFEAYDNINYMIVRTTRYCPIGRLESLEGAIGRDSEIEYILLNYKYVPIHSGDLEAILGNL